MKTYDFKNVKRYIQMHSDLIDEVSLGMAEDWGWTAECVYEDGRFKMDLDTTEEIAGISGSTWATPSMIVVFKDGREELIEVFKGQSTEGKPSWFELGVLSQPMQDYVDNINSPKLENKQELSHEI